MFPKENININLIHFMYPGGCSGQKYLSLNFTHINKCMLKCLKFLLIPIIKIYEIKNFNTRC